MYHGGCNLRMAIRAGSAASWPAVEVCNFNCSASALAQKIGATKKLYKSDDPLNIVLSALGCFGKLKSHLALTLKVICWKPP